MADLRSGHNRLTAAFLAPNIVAAILVGRQPIALTARKLERIGDLPIRWEAQRIALGHSRPA